MKKRSFIFYIHQELKNILGLDILVISPNTWHMFV